MLSAAPAMSWVNITNYLGYCDYDLSLAGECFQTHFSDAGYCLCIPAQGSFPKPEPFVAPQRK
jgi:hypothetical protein